MPAATKVTQRVCPECGVVFEGKGARKACGDECAYKRMKAQQAAHAAKQRKHMPTVAHCRECGGEFKPIHSKNVICKKLTCKAKALVAAVARQTVRRQKPSQPPSP